MNWYELNKEEVLELLDSDPDSGLSLAEVQRRTQQYGANELIDRGQKSVWKILWEQLTGIMVIILIISAVISLILGEYKDAIAILVIVVLNAVLGFTQEYRAEQAMAALKKLAVPVVRVRRDGHVQEVTARALVPGDIVLLEAGNLVPADCRLLEAMNLRVQEAVLTGESEPLDKVTEALKQAEVPLAEQRNMLFMGTVVTYGRGMAVVVETGMRTQLGQIAEMIQTVEQEPTPLQQRLNQLGKGLAIAALAIVAVVFVLGLVRGEDARLMFMTAISMAVAAVPEGLPAVVTIALALGAQRMLKRRALIRKLPAVETLGSVTVICSDKTGTLTQNRMTVAILDVAGHRYDLIERLRDYSPTFDLTEKAPEILQNPASIILLTAGALCNDAILEVRTDQTGFSAVGDPTEGALVVAAARAGLWKKELEDAMPRRAELPFESDRKRMTTVHELVLEKLPEALKYVWKQFYSPDNTPYLTVTKGAVDSLLTVCDRVWVDGKVHSLDDHWLGRIQTANNELAQNGMRVLGIAFRFREDLRVDDPANPLESRLIFVGMIAMIDPARPEAKPAVQTCRSAGIRPVMITGDHPLTALYIARELGIADQANVVSGQQLNKMSDEELGNIVSNTAVYARVSPEHKLRIVQALQDKGEVVAMTGDGVNDAPALKKAQIGVAMGITGTDVSKEASDMVLLDDNFATIVAAVEEGRRIYDNIRKFIKYTMTSNAGEIWTMLLAPFLGMPLPLTPLQILWVNLVTDGLPGLALAVEPAERDTMRRPPFHPNENIFGRGMARDILWVGLLMGLVSLLTGFVYWKADRVVWQTVVFTTLTLSQMGNAMAVRSQRDSLFSIGLLTNKAMLGSVLLTFALQMAVIYVPFLQGVFYTVALPLKDLLISLALSLVVFFSIEIFTFVLRKSAR
jgi:Ca2+-transporting ATPase